jgi:hypothetical protein
MHAPLENGSTDPRRHNATAAPRQTSVGVPTSSILVSAEAQEGRP